MRRTLVTALLLPVLGAGASTALAGSQPQYPTLFTKFKYKGGELFAGEIGSQKAGCVDGRKVVLFRKKGGDQKKLGSDKTDEKGKFKISLSGSVKEGTYYAKVKQDKIGNGEVCRKRQSPSVKVSTG